MTGGAGVSAKGGRGGGVPLREFAGVCHGPDPWLGWIRSRSLLLFFVLSFSFSHFYLFYIFCKTTSNEPKQNPKIF
jgi:hypothetical protein